MQRARAQLRQLLVARCEIDLDRRGDYHELPRPPRSLRLPRVDARGAGTVTPYPPACARFVALY